MARSKRKSGRRWISVALLFAIFSLWQFLETGSVSWPRTLLERISGEASEYAQHPDTGWRRATEAMGELGTTREGDTTPRFDLVGRVVRVADGDTVSVLDSHNKQHKIRLFGIDSPERDQPFGRAAGKALAKLVDNREVGVVRVETDQYGRVVGILYREGTNINQAQIAAGHAWWYRYHAPHERQFEAAEQSARQANRGLWSADKPIAPWDWRRGKR